jgi:hypothetical protein
MLKVQSEIPISQFEDIICELKTKPLEENRYRIKAGIGQSQAFGIVGRRCLPPDYSRNNWLRPKLYCHLLEFAEKFVDISWNAVTVNQNYKADKHRDKNNKGPSFLVAFGDYTGGNLSIYEGDLSGSHNIFCRPLITDFSKVFHAVEPFEGSRYSLVYYWFVNNRLGPLPAPSVKKEGGKYFFYRGEEKITPKTGLPHPLRNRKKVVTGIVKVEKEVRIDFL